MSEFLKGMPLIVPNFCLGDIPLDTKTRADSVTEVLTTLDKTGRFTGLTIFITSENSFYCFRNGIEDSNFVKLQLDSVINVANYASLPTTKQASNVVYVTLDDSLPYIWNNNTWLVLKNKADNISFNNNPSGTPIYSTDYKTVQKVLEQNKKEVDLKADKTYVDSQDLLKIDKTSIIDNLTTTDATKVLSANMGKKLNDNDVVLDNKITTHMNNGSNPHNTTKAQVGLGNVENLKPLDMPISTLTQNALNKKPEIADAIVGTNNVFSGYETTRLYNLANSNTNTSINNLKTEINTNLAKKVNITDIVDNLTSVDVNKPLSANQGKVLNNFATMLASDVNVHKVDKNNPHAVTKSQVGLGNVDNIQQIPMSQRGNSNGVATLDGAGKVPTTQLPSYVDDVLEFANLTSFPTSGESGKIYVAIDTNKTYRWSGTTYTYITSGAVDSVNGKTGVVSLVKADIGLNNVDNTSDKDKIISTYTQNALNLKAEAKDIEGNIPLLDLPSGMFFVSRCQDTIYPKGINYAYLLKTRMDFILTDRTTGNIYHKYINSGGQWVDWQEMTPNKAYVDNAITSINNNNIIALGNKVDKVTGKSLIDDTKIIKLDGISTSANKVETSATNGNIKIDGVEKTIYTHPSGTNPHGATKSDVGLSSVDNTSDINKPVSIPQQNALNLKSDVVYVDNADKKLQDNINAINTSITNSSICVIYQDNPFSSFGEPNASVFITATDIQKWYDKNKSRNGYLSPDTLNPLDLFPELPVIPNGMPVIWCGETYWVSGTGKGDKSCWKNMTKFVVPKFGSPVVPYMIAMGTTAKEGKGILGNCDNTADIDKILSTPQQTYIDRNCIKYKSLNSVSLRSITELGTYYVINCSTSLGYPEGVTHCVVLKEEDRKILTNIRNGDTYVYYIDPYSRYEKIVKLANNDYVDGEFLKKVDKVTGKSLVLDTEITKLSTVKNNATCTTESTTNGNIKIDGTEKTVYTHPTTHPAEMITQSPSYRFISDYYINVFTNKAERYHNHEKVDITDFPKLSPVATSGKYTDLTGVPPAIDVTKKYVDDALINKVDKAIGKSLILDSEITRLSTVTNYYHPNFHPASMIQGLSSVATSGSFSNLTGVPDFTTRAVVDSLLKNKAEVLHKHMVSDITNFPILSTVATSGSYNDLSNKPYIPTVDVNKKYIDDGLAKKIDITPGKSLMDDFEIARLYRIPSDANSTQKSAINGNVNINGYNELEVYRHPTGASATNPHNTTKSDVGLGNVDNVSDLNKPISTATKTALDGKLNFTWLDGTINKNFLDLPNGNFYIEKAKPENGYPVGVNYAYMTKNYMDFFLTDRTSGKMYHKYINGGGSWVDWQEMPPSKAYIDNGLSAKVDVVSGKSLVDNTQITKLSTVSQGANKVELNGVNGRINVDGVEKVVYTHPSLHPASIITGLARVATTGNYNDLTGTPGLATQYSSGFMGVEEKKKVDNIPLAYVYANIKANFNPWEGGIVKFEDVKVNHNALIAMNQDGTFILPVTGIFEITARVGLDENTTAISYRIYQGDTQVGMVGEAVDMKGYGCVHSEAFHVINMAGVTNNKFCVKCTWDSSGVVSMNNTYLKIVQVR